MDQWTKMDSRQTFKDNNIIVRNLSLGVNIGAYGFFSAVEFGGMT
jgi:hypothetical protein